MEIHGLQIEPQPNGKTCWAAASLCILRHYRIPQGVLPTGQPLLWTMNTLLANYPTSWFEEGGGSAGRILKDFDVYDSEYNLKRVGMGGDAESLYERIRQRIGSSVGRGLPVLMRVVGTDIDQLRHFVVVCKEHQGDLTILDPDISRAGQRWVYKLRELLNGSCNWNQPKNKWDYVVKMYAAQIVFTKHPSQRKQAALNPAQVIRSRGG